MKRSANVCAERSADILCIIMWNFLWNLLGKILRDDDPAQLSLRGVSSCKAVVVMLSGLCVLAAPILTESRNIKQ